MFDLKLEGHKFWVLERDGNLLLRPVQQSHVFLPPGARATLVVEAADRPGPMRCARSTSTPARRATPTRTIQIGTFIVEGKPVSGGGAILARLRKGPAGARRRSSRNPNQLRKARSAGPAMSTSPRRRTATRSSSTNKTYNENRVDTTVRLGEIERWIVRNYSGEMHVFHLHQTEFLVDKFSGTPDQTLGSGMRDVINIPYAKGGKPGIAELIIPFTNPVMVGEFVYHCHIVGHEDAGMMANIRSCRRRLAEGYLGPGHPAGRPRGAARCWPAPGRPRARSARRCYGELDANICRAPQENGIALQ